MNVRHNIKRRNLSQRDLHVRLFRLTTFVNTWRRNIQRGSKKIATSIKHFLRWHILHLCNVFLLIISLMTDKSVADKTRVILRSQSSALQLQLPVVPAWSLTFAIASPAQSLTTSNCPAWPVGAVKSEQEQTTRRASSGSARRSLSPWKYSMSLLEISINSHKLFQ